MEIRFALPFLFSIILLFASCEKEELAVEPHSSGDLNVTQIELGSDYDNQVFYSLKTNTIVAQNEKSLWDLGFEASDTGWHVKMNTARGGAIAQTTETEFSKVNSEKGLTWKHDVHSGNLDSTAVGDYRNNDWVYVMDRGYLSDGTHTGYYKFKVRLTDENKYEIEYAEVSSSSTELSIIVKNERVNFECFSFNSKGVVPIEPPKESWDLYFGNYTYIFIVPPQAYTVTGVLANPYKVKIAENHQAKFEDISIENSDTLNYKTEADVIGWEWKVFDFDARSYTVFIDQNWVVEDHAGRRFKLHFLDFYNDQGEKGAPKFEFQEL